MVEVKPPRQESPGALMGIGELARQTGATPSALRFYERRELLAPVRRDSGRRRYDHEAVRTVRLLLGAQRAGFSLEEIRVLLGSYDGSRPAPADWHVLAEEKLQALDDTVRRRKAMQ